MSALRMGIDTGSTTAKLAILEPGGEILFSTYKRHHADTLGTLRGMLGEARHKVGDTEVDLLLTGSAGMGVSEAFDLPFIQEVVASAELVHQRHPAVRMLIDIGGEDAKMIFFDEWGRPDIRMNGSCAGGTGAFIDEMAALLNIPITELDRLASRSTDIYPIAARCGVFAKTDLQNLVNRKVPREDIAASVFHAIVLQLLATLARGYEPQAPVIFCGGPLTFMPQLREAFMRAMKFDGDCVVEIPSGEFVPAIGAALAQSRAARHLCLSELESVLSGEPVRGATGARRLPPLVGVSDVNGEAPAAQGLRHTEQVSLQELSGRECFLGVDSGSTTTKVVLIDSQARIAFKDYRGNGGDPVHTLRQVLQNLGDELAVLPEPPRIVSSTVTGYAEDLIRAAFGFDRGIVETLAHFEAARTLDPDVSFIMDIGGQDMKAIFVEDGHIRNIEINEACSSGCGTFIENFARAMGYSASDFGSLALEAREPCDLGTRCTVFMNSKVKQSLREGASVRDISAGLAYSVIKNALHKVLKVNDTRVLGDHIVVQGGTFRSPAVRRAFEQVVGRPVLCPDIAELMGAYGAALVSLRNWDPQDPAAEAFVGLKDLAAAELCEKTIINCRGCENRCTVHKLAFPNGNLYYTGNRCENIYSNSRRAERRGVNLPALKEQFLFERPMQPAGDPVLTLGIPRVLNMFQNFPFWNTLFVESGIRVVLSPPSSKDLYDTGAGTIASENICYPAKLVHGHVLSLIGAGVDRIFYPMVFYEDTEFPQARNRYQCPIVSGYADVIRSTIDPHGRHGVPMDSPSVNFGDRHLLRRACDRYLAGLGIPARIRRRAFKAALQAERAYKQKVQDTAREILAAADQEGRPVAVLMGRPYHIDRQINHKTADILTNLGMDVITEDAVPVGDSGSLDHVQMLTSWENPNRIYRAVQWASQRPDTHMVQLNSFGCGPDAYVVDEARGLAREYSSGLTVLRIDEVESSGSARLRLRSMLEVDRESAVGPRKPRPATALFERRDQGRSLLVPRFSEFCTAPLVRPITDRGFRVELMDPSDRDSVDLGLKYSNNEICYPGTLVVGDTIKALQSGKYDRSKFAIGLFETGGQCRASCIYAATRKAMVQAGFQDVPVVTVSTGGARTNKQPGFQYSIPKMMHGAVIGLAYSDALSAMYHSTAVREVQPGQAEATAAGYMARLEDGRLPLQKQAILEHLAQAVVDFNKIETRDTLLPKVAVVGEIYVKYNRFSNNNVVGWLMSQGVEALLPPFVDFFATWFVSVRAQLQNSMQRPGLLSLMSGTLNRYFQAYLDDVAGVLSAFRYYLPQHTIQDLGARAAQILSLTHQYGESWLIAGEVAAFAESGVPNVLCLQPFGCIANHVVAKGVEKRLRAQHPGLNLLFLDTDHATSEVNYFNRLHFFVNSAREGMENQKAPGELLLAEAAGQDR